MCEFIQSTFFEIKEFSSGKTHYDWVIPDEWTINDAYIKDSKGDKIVDFKECNLHVIEEPVANIFDMNKLAKEFDVNISTHCTDINILKECKKKLLNDFQCLTGEDFIGFSQSLVFILQDFDIFLVGIGFL